MGNCLQLEVMITKYEYSTLQGIIVLQFKINIEFNFNSIEGIHLLFGF